MSLWKKMRPPLVTSLVATAGKDGSVNASPKSWWSPVSYEPPILMLSVKPGSDTDVNINATGLFVLHMPPEDWAKEVLHTAKPLPYGENELDDQGLPWKWLEEHGTRVAPYLPDIPWMCCWVTEKLEAHPSRSDHNLYLGQVGKAGGFAEDEGVIDALIHRGRNEFMELGKPFKVQPY